VTDRPPREPRHRRRRPGARTARRARRHRARPAAPPDTTYFGNDIEAVVEAVLDDHLPGRGGNRAGLDRARRLALFRSLDERGVFAVRRAVGHVAARLGVSRASAYSYLSKARGTAAPTAAPTPDGGTA
jgi:hypothetical protein